ncbi:MAG: histidine kinase [Bacteroidetes bacterium]|nr:histidine kinase [Bacteroidota bacterium]
MKNPYLKGKDIFSGYTAAWILIALTQASVFYFFLEIDLDKSVIDSIISNCIFFLIGIGLWFPSKFISFEESSTLKILVNHLTAALVTSVIWVALTYLIMKQMFPLYETTLMSSLLWRFFLGILYYLLLTALNYVMIYYNNFQNKILEESELRALVKEAELKTLKYQINPHFIFNSLNSISSLTLSNPSKAQEMTILLSSFLRNTLSKNLKEKNLLSEEIENLKLYLNIEKIRFEDKFDFICDINKECGEVPVPNMILQPILENALKHGVYESVKKVQIRLNCTKGKEYLIIAAENNYDKDALPRKGEGIGLINIKNRLRLIYNQDNLLTTEKKEGSFIAKLYIPLAL